MCNPQRLLGENHSAYPADKLSAARLTWEDELVQLGQAKLGRECTIVHEPGDLVRLEVGEERSFGTVPWWSVRSVDRVDVRRLALKFFNRLREDGLVDLVVQFFELEEG